MKKNDYKKNHTVRETNTRIEEESLWALDDHWDDNDTLEISPDAKNEESSRPNEIDELALETDPTPHEEAPTPHEESPTPHEEAPTGEPSPATPTQKITLSITEKISLSALAALLLGLAIWGYVFLYQKNFSETEGELKLPVQGQFATISEFNTSWTSAGKSAGIKLGVAVVPTASITLDEASSSGTLRIFFRNAKEARIGDPVTISFQGGKFTNPNKKNLIHISDDGATATISSSDGFSSEGDFYAYQMDSSLAWKVHILEAENTNSAGTDYQEMFNTKMQAKRR
ncbi:MAG: hypothetical protein KJO21_06870 [Verrucomicrobiae bacterium]|nr:hypothetical protein [Verrucomicrobiae bacterium]NNJ42476.1 hypothetical protein [Akkermansiaceae bacterium]